MSAAVSVPFLAIVLRGFWMLPRRDVVKETASITGALLIGGRMARQLAAFKACDAVERTMALRRADSRYWHRSVGDLACGASQLVGDIRLC